MFNKRVCNPLRFKQRTIACLSIESKYKAITKGPVEISWLWMLLIELGIALASPPMLWCDNLGASYLSANPIFHARVERMEIDLCP